MGPAIVLVVMYVHDPFILESFQDLCEYTGEIIL